MCKKNIEHKSISLEELYCKIRESKDVYENEDYKCSILLCQGKSTNPLATSIAEKNVEAAINAVKARLEMQIVKNPVKFIFQYILKQDIGTILNRFKVKELWNANVDVTDIVTRNDAFVANAEENAKKIRKKMDNPIIKNKLH